MKNKLKILDLFSGTQSVRKALDVEYKIQEWKLENGVWCGYTEDDLYEAYEPTIEYIGIDIDSPEAENTIFDLTQPYVIGMLKGELPYEWKPDFIWASPVCNKFSTACAYVGGNLFFEKVGDNNIKIRTKWDDKKSKSYTYEKCQINKKRYIQEATLALKMHNNTKRIIDHFDVPFAIENPRRAMSKYLYKDYVNNFTSYCMYGFQYEKPTTIYTKHKLELKICDHRPKRKYHTIMLSGSKKDYTDGRKNLSGYAQRSSVPPELIVSILKQGIIWKK